MLSGRKIGKQELSWVMMEKGYLEGRKKGRGIERHGGSRKATIREQNEERYKMLVEPGKGGIIQWMTKKVGKI